MESILFIYRNKNLANKFVDHFKINGYDLYEFYDKEIPYYKFNRFQKLENIIYRLFFKDVQHIHKINQRNFSKINKTAFQKLKRENKKFDQCFVIRGDLVPYEVLEYARSISSKMVDYQLDGLAVSSKILEYENLFDQIYVFDQSDVVNYPNYNLKAITNCFFEDKNFQNKSIDFSYIGVNTESRKQILENLYDYLKRINPEFVIEFYLKQDEFHSKTSNKIKFLEESFTYQQSLDLSNQSKILVDIKRKEHDGLSLRFFEAMNYKNKIITNNPTVSNYDFYHPDNIYITDYVDFEGIESFLEKPYFQLEQEIIDKYNFKNWIKRILI